MDFPKSIIDKDEYFKKIYSLLNDNDCLIFLDTNILALFFRLYDSARLEFFNWIDPFIKTDRVKTPTWALNEYAKRFIKGQVQDYLNPGAKLKTISKDLTEVVRYLKMHVSDDEFKASGFDHAKLDSVREEISRLSSVASKKESYIIKVHDEIQKLFSQTVLSSDIYSILNRVCVSGPNRFQAQLPPGYKDGNKEFNETGDLIIWEEILAFARDHPNKKIIFLSNDNKPDWLYTPNLITYSGLPRPIANKKMIQLADPRLVYEYKLITGSNEFFIINFETLTKILINKSNNDFFELAKALQIANEEENRASDDIYNFDLNTTSLVELEDNQQPQPIVKASKIEEKSKTTSVPKNHAEVIHEYVPEALADAAYAQFENQDLGKIIEALRSYDWHIQNPAIEKFYAVSGSIPNEVKIDNDLFVLGRNIYQAACGGAWAAVSYLRHLKKNIQQLSDDFKNPLVSGIFYEIYFNKDGMFRKGYFKTGFIDSVFELQTMPDLKESVSFIRHCLKGYEEFLVILPNQNPERVEFDIIYRLSTDDFSERVCEISSIRYLDEELLVARDEEDILWFSDFTISDTNQLKSLFVRSLAVPENQLTLNFIPPLNEMDFEWLLIPKEKALWKGPSSSS